MLNPDEGIELGTSERPPHSLRVLARFTSLGELVRITDELAAQNADLRALLTSHAAVIGDLERRVRHLEGGR